MVAAVELAFNVTVPPTHMGPLFVGAATGVALTVTTVVYMVDGLHPEPVVLTVSE